MRLTDIQIDALAELINIGVGRAGRILSEMVDSKVSLKVPSVMVLPPLQARAELAKIAHGQVAAVRLSYSGRFSGSAVLYFPPRSAALLANALVGDRSSGPDLDALQMGTITEVGNIMLNGIVGSIANILEDHVQFSVPVYEEGIAHELIGRGISSEAKVVVIAETGLDVEELHLKGETVLLLETDSFEILLEAIDKTMAGYKRD